MDLIRTINRIYISKSLCTLSHLALLVCTLLTLPAHAMEEGLADYGKDMGGVRHVTAAEAGEILQKFPTVKVLDVRTGLEYDRGHLTDATNINYYGFSFKKQLQQLDKNVTWLVHCRSGVRSGKSLPIMKAMGFTSIIHLDGGIVAWANEDLPIKK